MAQVCDCNVSLGNSGTPNCELIAGVTRNLIIVPTFDDAGVRNFIDTTTTLDTTFFTALINQSDASKRWFPFPAMENVEDVRGEDSTDSFNSGNTAFIQNGVRTFTGLMIKKSTTFLGKIENYRCTDISAFIITKSGAIVGNGSEAGKLYPIKLDSETWSPKLAKTTDTTVQRIQLDFAFNQDENDSDLRMITDSETSIDVRTLSGLLDVNAVISAPLVAGFTATLTMDYGSQVTKKPVKGLLLSDFDLNETSPTPGAEPFSVNESADGVYDFTYTTPVASGDILALDLTKDGFEMTTAVITTP